MYRSRLENISFFAFFAGVSLLLFFIFAPFIQTLALAAVFAVLLHTPHEKLSEALGGRKSIAAILLVITVIIFIITPLFFLGSQIFQEAQNLYNQSPTSETHYIQTIQTSIETPMQRFYPGFSLDIRSYITNTLGLISNNLAVLVSSTLYIILQTFLMLLAFFFFLRDGKGLLTSLTEISPFGKREAEEIFFKMYQTITAVLRGTLFTALIRLILIGLGFYIFGIPNTILWSSIGGAVGAIPGLGTPFVFIPAVIYLYLQGNMLATVGLTIFGSGVIILVDNILTPYFFGKGLEVAPVFVLFAIIGGILFFGPLGFILGPLVLSVFLSLLNTYSLAAQDKETL